MGIGQGCPDLGDRPHQSDEFLAPQLADALGDLATALDVARIIGEHLLQFARCYAGLTGQLAAIIESSHRAAADNLALLIGQAEFGDDPDGDRRRGLCRLVELGFDVLEPSDQLEVPDGARGEAASEDPGEQGVDLGPHLTYHLAAGEGGVRAFIQHLLQTYEGIWEDLPTWSKLEPEQHRRLVAAVERAYAEDTDRIRPARDRRLAAILRGLELAKEK